MSRAFEVGWSKSARDAYVKVDGKLIQHVTKLTLVLDVADGLPRLAVECIATDGLVRVEEGEVEITPRTVAIAQGSEDA